MAEKEKPQRQVPREPDIAGKVEPLEIRTPVSRDWLNTHFKADLDQMSAAAVGGQGWTEEEVLRLEGYVKKWNGILGVEMKLHPFKEPIAVSGKPIETTCSEGGVLYLNRISTNYMFCPDVFVAHEVGHYIETMEFFGDSDAMRRTRNVLRHQGLMHQPDSILNTRVLMPPFGIPTWHDADIPTEWVEQIGYNFRQINCDSIAFQKRDESGQDLRDLTCQYLDYLELGRQGLERDVKQVLQERGKPAVQAGLFMCGSDIARFTAGAWVMGILAREILHDEGLAQRAQQLTGLSDLSQPRKESPSSFEELLESYLTTDQVRAFVVVTQAYKEHFIASLGIRDLFRKERMGPHLERLDPDKTDHYTVENEILLIGYMRDDRFTDVLISKSSQRAIWALGEVGSHKAIEHLIKLLDDPQVEVVDGEANGPNRDWPDWEEYPVRTAAHLALARAGKNAIPALLKQLEGDNPEHRWRCALSLGLMYEEAQEAIPALERLAESELSSAHWALGRIYGSLGNDELEYRHYKRFLETTSDEGEGIFDVENGVVARYEEAHNITPKTRLLRSRFSQIVFSTDLHKPKDKT